MNKIQQIEEVVREKAREEAELSVFWGLISSNLPKTPQMHALGTKPIYEAFKIAYPEIRKLLIGQYLRDLQENN